MGFFDLPAPLLSWVDGTLLGWLPVLARLSLWGLVAALVTMLLFKRVSRQERIREIKRKVKANQAKMADFDGEMSDLMPLVGQTLKLAGRQFLLALGPALLASVPVIFLLAWLSNHFGYQVPQTGQPVKLRLASEAAPAGLRDFHITPASAAVSESAGEWYVDWPASGESVSLRHADSELLALPPARLSPVIHKREWWNWLVGNPLGYLDRQAPVDAVYIDLPKTRVLNAGPDWVRGWMFTFFLAFLVFSIALKFVLKIE